LKATANLRQKGETPGTEFIKTAAEQLIKCRRVLKYTYVMGYYLPDGTPEKGLFELHQEMLEKNTEKLYDYTQQPCVEKLDVQEVINMTRVTARFLDSLLESLHGGMVHNGTDSA
jgi:ariadne-1